MFQRRPCDLQEYAVLRIHDLRLARVDAEEPGVEQLRVLKHAPGFDVVGILGEGRIHASRDHLLFAEGTDRLHAIDEVLPELIQITGAGESSRHADNSDIEVADTVDGRGFLG